MSLKISWKHVLLVAVSLVGIILVFMKAPIPQSQEYHHFADDQLLFGIPHFRNVMSNIPFIIAGIWGIVFLLRTQKPSSLDIGSLVFFFGILFTAFGSIWYHLHPDNDTIVWDRLPMTIAFMAFFSVLIRECLDVETGKKLLWPLLFLGLLSVCYWQMTEQRGQGDLRFYFLVQFLPMCLIPLILLLFRSRSLPKAYFWLVLLAYVIAKVFELKDAEVFDATGISGHTIKHLVAAIAPLIYLAGLKSLRFSKTH